MTTLLPDDDIAKRVGEVLKSSPFRVRARLQSPRLIRNTNYGLRADATVELEWEGITEQFAAEYKASGTPKQIDAALNQISRNRTENGQLAPMIITPYLQPKIIDKLVQDRVSAIDLSGNYVIIVPGRWLVIRTGAKNQYPNNAPIKNIYRGTSSLIPRLLMLRGEMSSPMAIWSELEKLGPVSKSTISKVLTALEEEIIIQRERVIRVIQPATLLENLAINYKPPLITKRVAGTLTLSQEVIDRFTTNSTEQDVMYAVDSSAKYAIVPASDETIRIYTTDIDRLLRNVSVEASTRFTNVALLQTPEQSIFIDRQLRGGLYYTSPLQIYLELQSGGKREKQAAQQLREQLLHFEYR